VEWLVASIVLSVVLTVVLNLVVRAFPRATDRAMERLDERMRSAEAHAEPGRRVKVYFPWKTMLLASIVLTVVLNVALALTR
jgi:hypothetical protein